MNSSTPKHDMLEVQMTEASLQYLQSGIIPDALLQCFDQHGKWLGDTAASEYVDPKALEKLASVTIPENRRCIKNEIGESILLTSYMLKNSPDPILVVPWHEIRGMCVIEIEGNLTCPNLRRLNPIYTPVTMLALTIRLPELTKVESLIVGGGHISIPKLALAHYLEFDTVRHIEAPRLQSVEHLQLGSAFSAKFPMLREVKGPLVGYAIREFFAPILESVNTDSAGHIGLKLTEAWTIDTPNLKYVGVSLDSRSAETFYLPELTVKGIWEMHPNTVNIKARLLLRGPFIEI